MNAARSMMLGRRGLAGAVVATILLLPAAGEACSDPGSNCGARASGSSVQAQSTDVMSIPSFGGQSNACERSGRSQICERVEEPSDSSAPPASSPSATPSASPSASASSPPSATASARARPAVREAVQVTPVSAPAPRRAAPRAAQAEPEEPVPDRGPVVVSRIVEVFRDRPAVGISMAAGIVVALGLFVIYLMVTRRRRRERVAAAEASVRDSYGTLTSSLVGTLSHELYTPLTPVKWYASMLKEGRLPPAELGRLADDLVCASTQLERLFDMMVALADIQREAPDIDRDVVEIDALIGDALEHLPTSDHSLTVEVEPDLPSIRGNEKLLTLAIGALVDNAVKFSPPGSPVRIDVGARDGGGRALLDVTVTDQGVGMTPEQLRVAFDPFRQADGSLSRRYGGLGVGLALTEHVARAHRGRLLASSRPGEGSTFTLSIPMTPAVRSVAVTPWTEQHTG